MTPEVKAAAERLRRVKSGEPLNSVYGEPLTNLSDKQRNTWLWDRMCRDDETLADAYLALFDPTPLSLDALTAELGEPNPNTLGVLYWSWTVSSREVTLRKDGLCCVASLDVTTLGELRRILSITTLGRSEKK